MKRLFIALMLIAGIGAQAQTWDELNARPYPQWFGEAKLGIFVHWGLYSVPAYASKEGYAEWFYRGLMVNDSGRRQIMSLYADTSLPVFEQYSALTEHWHGELWQPQEWASMFREAGAKYVVLVTKHHDGYCLWDSPLQPEWNSVTSGPGRNIVCELTEAVRNEGMRMGFYYSLPEWNNPRHIWMQDPDSAIGDYVDNYMVPQFKELVSRYKPELIFADGDWQNTAEQWRSVELIDWYYKTVGADAIVNDRWGQGTKHGFKTPEYSAGISVTDRPWAECRGLGRSFGYNRNEDLDNYLSSTELIQHFCELVANGGGLTLNVGPYADGTIPLIQQERLRDLGKWLGVNGEAIYGSRSAARFRPADHEKCTAELPYGPIAYDWVRNAPLKGMPVDKFSIEWVVSYTAPVEGDYIFRLRADDEATVTEFGIDAGDTLLYYNNAWAENKAGQATFHLKPLPVSWLALVHYTEKDLEASVSLEVSADSGKTFEPLSPVKWGGTASWQRTIRCFTQKGDNLYVIEFERPGQTLTLQGMPLLKRGASISLLGTTGNLKWKQKKDGTLTIDLSKTTPEEMNALKHAWVLKISPID